MLSPGDLHLVLEEPQLVLELAILSLELCELLFALFGFASLTFDLAGAISHQSVELSL